MGKIKLSHDVANVLFTADLTFISRIVLYKHLVDFSVLPNINISLALNGMCGQTIIHRNDIMEILAYFPSGTSLSTLTLAIAKFGCIVQKIK